MSDENDDAVELSYATSVASIEMSGIKSALIFVVTLLLESTATQGTCTVTLFPKPIVAYLPTGSALDTFTAPFVDDAVGNTSYGTKPLPSSFGVNNVVDE